MNQRKSKVLTKLAKSLASHSDTYLVKRTNKTAYDLQGEPLFYTTDQTVLHPKSQKSIKKFLKKLDKEGLDLNTVQSLTELVASETTAKLTELAKAGYTL